MRARRDFYCHSILWSVDLEDAVLFSGATRGEGIEARVCSVIFGVISHRSPWEYPWYCGFSAVRFVNPYTHRRFAAWNLADPPSQQEALY